MEYKIINPKQDKLRAFYRIAILPRHVEGGSAALKKDFETELEEHIEWVKEHKLGTELKAYVKAYQDRQDAYDKLAKMRGEFAVLRGTDMNRLDVKELEGHAKQLMKMAQDLDAAEAAFTKARDSFMTQYGNPRGVASATVTKGD